MKRIITGILALGLASAAGAQTGIDEVLLRVENRSKEMQALREETTARKTEARTDKFMADPSVEFEHLWGGHGERDAELTLSQEVDFPTVYGARNKIARIKSSLAENEGQSTRQQILLEAKLLCIEIVYLNRQRTILGERLANAERLFESYRKMMDTGDANILDYNKANLERVDARTRYELNEAQRAAQCLRLNTLCGGGEDDFSELTYAAPRPLPGREELEALYTDGDPELHSLADALDMNRRTVTLNRALSLPRFEVGYRHNFGAEGRFKGFQLGMSIPLFENKNKVKAAKAQTLSADARLQSARTNSAAEFRELYDRALALQHSREALESVLQTQNGLPVLDKSLEAGQITLVEYFDQIETFYRSRETLLELDRDYQSTLARIFRFEL